MARFGPSRTSLPNESAISGSLPNAHACVRTVDPGRRGERAPELRNRWVVAHHRLSRLEWVRPQQYSSRRGRRAKPISARVIPTTRAMAATPKATTDVNNDACRNAESAATARFGSSWSSWA